jgi:hypothetical protein
LLKDSVPCPIPNVQEVGRSTALASGVENTRRAHRRNVQLVRSRALHRPSQNPVAETTQNRRRRPEEINKGLRKLFIPLGLACAKGTLPVSERGRMRSKLRGKADPGVNLAGIDPVPRRPFFGIEVGDGSRRDRIYKNQMPDSLAAIREVRFSIGRDGLTERKRFA